MEGSSLPGHKPGLAPGMSQIIVAGEEYTITDDQGQELELVGKDDPLVIEFLHAFDAWQSICNTLGHGHESSVNQFSVVLEKWSSLPERLLTDMPSYRAGGIVVPGRSDVTLPHRH